LKYVKVTLFRAVGAVHFRITYKKTRNIWYIKSTRKIIFQIIPQKMELSKKNRAFWHSKNSQSETCVVVLCKNMYWSFDNRSIRVLTKDHNTNFALCTVKKFVLNLTHLSQTVHSNYVNLTQHKYIRK